jgi:hypothetical protein
VVHKVVVYGGARLMAGGAGRQGFHAQLARPVKTLTGGIHRASLGHDI